MSERRDTGARLNQLEANVHQLHSNVQSMDKHLVGALDNIAKIDLILEALADLVGRDKLDQAIRQRSLAHSEAIEAQQLAQLRAEVEAGRLVQVVQVDATSVVFYRREYSTGARKSLILDASQPALALLLGKAAGDVVAEDGGTILAVYQRVRKQPDA